MKIEVRKDIIMMSDLKWDIYCLFVFRVSLKPDIKKVAVEVAVETHFIICQLSSVVCINAKNR